MPWALPDHVAAPANRPHIGAKRGLMPRFFSRNRSGWMRDPYEVLGVQKSASPEDIKRAFRRLAKKLHPDANKKDATAAKFAELNSAYELLGDEKKRKAFDRGEIDAEGKPRFHGFQTAGAGRGPGGFGREGHFETFTWGPEGFRRWAAALSRGRGFRRDPPWPGYCGRTDDHARRGGQGRHETHAAADRQGRRRQDPPRIDRWPADPAERPGPARTWRSRRRRLDQRRDRPAPAVQDRGRQSAPRAADYALRGRLGNEGSRSDPRRRGGAGHSARRRCRPHVPAEGQRPADPRRPRRSLRHHAHRAPRPPRPRARGDDAALARDQTLRSAQDDGVSDNPNLLGAVSSHVWRLAPSTSP